MPHHCPICHADNAIVNQCGCDPKNMPTTPSFGEPWTFDGLTSDLKNAAGETVVCFYGAMGVENTQDHIDRIIACVNALRGKNPAALIALLDAAVEISRAPTMAGPAGVVSLLAGEAKIKRLRQAIQRVYGEGHPSPSYWVDRTAAENEDAHCACCGTAVPRGVAAQEVRGYWVCNPCINAGCTPEEAERPSPSSGRVSSATSRPPLPRRRMA